MFELRIVDRLRRKLLFDVSLGGRLLCWREPGHPPVIPAPGAECEAAQNVRNEVDRIARRRLERAAFQLRFPRPRAQVARNPVTARERESGAGAQKLLPADGHGFSFPQPAEAVREQRWKVPFCRAKTRITRRYP